MTSQSTVVHVDDDPVLLDLSSDWAGGREGLTWLTTTDPEDGLGLVADHDVDCLVSDSLSMPDGTPFVAHAADVAPSVPVVVFTATPRDAVDAEIRRIASRCVEKGSAGQFVRLFDSVSALAGGAGDAETAADDGDAVGVDRSGSRLSSRPLERSEGSGRDGSWVPIDQYDWTDPDTDLGTTIVVAVEEYTGREAETVAPLYESIDADALETLLRRPGGGERRGVQVRFFYAEQELAVTSEGLILLRSETA